MVVPMPPITRKRMSVMTDPMLLLELYQDNRDEYRKVVRYLMPLRKTAMNRLMNRIRIDDQGNWVDAQSKRQWGETGSNTRFRDRQMKFAGSTEYVHRVAWMLFRGEIPEGHSLLRDEGRELSICPSHMRCLPHAEVMAELAERRARAAEGEN